MDLHVFPIPIPPPASLPFSFLWVFPVHSYWEFSEEMVVWKSTCLFPLTWMYLLLLLLFSKIQIGKHILWLLQAVRHFSPCSMFPDSSVGKESACNAGDPSLIPGLGRSPGEGKGYPFQYSGLENSMDCISPWGHKESDMTNKQRSLSPYSNDTLPVPLWLNTECFPTV